MVVGKHGSMLAARQAGQSGSVEETTALCFPAGVRLSENGRSADHLGKADLAAGLMTQQSANTAA